MVGEPAAAVGTAATDFLRPKATFHGVQFDPLVAHADAEVRRHRQAELEVPEGAGEAAALLLVPAAARGHADLEPADVVVGVVALHFEAQAVAQPVANRSGSRGTNVEVVGAFGKLRRQSEALVLEEVRARSQADVWTVWRVGCGHAWQHGQQRCRDERRGFQGPTLEGWAAKLAEVGPAWQTLTTTEPKS